MELKELLDLRVLLELLASLDQEEAPDPRELRALLVQEDCPETQELKV